mmetsp:Transcript_8356/g.26129  ORF Transcript_8356/g.26129 Transcript_8356/m.26129 type:complete len:95 (+) Transcript_8356:243-527(+)
MPALSPLGGWFLPSQGELALVSTRGQHCSARLSLSGSGSGSNSSLPERCFVIWSAALLGAVVRGGGGGGSRGSRAALRLLLPVSSSVTPRFCRF